jgi:hypothetical protein
LIVLSLIRNGSAWLPSFIDHYRALGARHIVLLDNDSTDDTIEIATARPDVSVFRTALSFARYRVVLKRWLVHTFGRGGWSLVADADELFDYPASDRLDLRGFLTYLNRRGFTAVVGQMLDMFPGEPLAEVQGRTGEDLRVRYPFYDISAITRTTGKYWLRMNQRSTDSLYMHDGGIRASAFGWQWSNLTKLPVMRYGTGLSVFPYDEHFVTGARLADVSGVLLHYKFTGASFEQVREEKQREQHYGKATIYKRYDEVLTKDGALCLRGATARELSNTDELVESGFLVASDEYARWVEANGR